MLSLYKRLLGSLCINKGNVSVSFARFQPIDVNIEVASNDIIILASFVCIP